ncbi:NAD-dependent histone deacetylase sir2 [Tulasnella sp. 417]|nr:NAD-dependent histone deacetylase sir2 [Tulasnella sp. 417]
MRPAPASSRSSSKASTPSIAAKKRVPIDFSYDVDSEGYDEQDLDSESEELEMSEEMKQQLEQALTMFPDEEVERMIGNLKEDGEALAIEELCKPFRLAKIAGNTGMVAWLKEYVIRRAIPIRQLLLGLGVLLTQPPKADIEDMSLLPLLKVTLTRILRRRTKLPQYNTVDDVLSLLRTSKRIVVLTGAGISVSIRVSSPAADFRSANGLYATLNREGKYELDDPQQMFDIHYFKEHPEVFYSFASQIYPSNFTPSPCHRFIKLLEDRAVLLRNYTQNIDTLESKLGVQKVLRCHGSFATASCLQCRRKVPGAEIEEAIFAKEIPICSVCKAAPPPPQIKRRKSGGKKKGKRPWDGDSSGDDLPTAAPPKPTAIMKYHNLQPDITFFGEAVTDDFDKYLLEDRGKADLLLVIGTSLKVAPVSELLSRIFRTQFPRHDPPFITPYCRSDSTLQILINKTPVPHVNPDIVLLGDADAVVKYLCSRLRWKLPGLPTNNEGLPPEPERVADSHVWLFEGAEGGSWVERLRQGSVESDKEAITSATAIGLSPNVGKTDNSSGGVSGKMTPIEVEGDPRQTKKARLG